VLLAIALVAADLGREWRQEEGEEEDEEEEDDDEGSWSC
jgi:hypothetical protein